MATIETSSTGVTSDFSEVAYDATLPVDPVNALSEVGASSALANEEANTNYESDEISSQSNYSSSSKARGILDRLARLEQSQSEMMARLKTDHEKQMDELREKLRNAELRRKEAHSMADDAQSAPVLMEVNMTEVEAAVQAASYAEQESSMALEEARKVVRDARVASGNHEEPKLITTGEISGKAGDDEIIEKRVTVNLDEVERVISNCPLISVCRAFGRPDSKYGNQVYCAVVPKRNMRVNETMLIVHAQKYLGTPMIPKRFYFLEDLPSGITRQALADTKLKNDLNSPISAPLAIEK